MAGFQHLQQTLIQRLTADATLNALVSGRVYAHAPPPDAAPPYVLFVVADMRDLTAMPVYRAIVRGLVYVYAVVNANNTAQAQQIADRIDVLLHGWSSSPNIFAVTRERIILDVEQTERRLHLIAGGAYDVYGAVA